MTRSRFGPGPDRLIVARLDGIAMRRAHWGAATEDEKAAGWRNFGSSPATARIC